MTASATDPLALERIHASGLVAQVEYHASLPSTQLRAHEIANDGNAGKLPLLIVAEEQTAGRGRGANRWWTGRGSLAFSLMFDPGDWNLSRRPAPERSLVVGVAIVDALQPRMANAALGLHWPNDVFVDQKKLAGILIDVLPDGRHIVGIGINVNNSLAAAPADVQARATTLCDWTAGPVDRTALLLDVLANSETALRSSDAMPWEFGARFQQLCLQAGHELTIDIGSRRASGRCAGIAPDGALLLETQEGLERFYSGVLR